MLGGMASVAVVAFLIGFTTRSPVLMGLCIVVGLVCTVGTAVVFIDRHLRANSRTEHMTHGELAALRSTLHSPAGTPGRLAPPVATTPASPPPGPQHPEAHG